MSPSLAAIDANLLVALDVLLTERHVTRAAKRLGVTQSAMSQTLQRLRDALDDPLLVRSGPRMVATPRAEAIAGPLRAALQALTQTLAGPARFEPATSDRVFRVAMLDHSAYTMLPGLLSTLAKAGPGLQIEVLTLDLAVIWDQLRAGDVELAVIGPWQAPPDVMTEQLFMDHMTSMVRADHAILDGPMTVEQYTAWPHAVFRLTGRGGFAIDDLLAEVGAQR
ncbi:MAG: LysR family transcriptional regulator, partial [Myxococcales bacterium]|nr:LysR family transcriptional regulator [Myxococcales bacterium]